MNFKIIPANDIRPEVLLCRYRDEDGNETVNILSVGYIDDCEDCFARETIAFNSGVTASCFIDDFSDKSADAWCVDQDDISPKPSE